MRNFHKGFIAPLLLALIAILLIGGGAYVYVQNKPVNQPAVATQTVQATSTAQTTDSQTTDWKTYRNEKYGFEIQYPQDLTLVDKADNNFTALIRNADRLDFVIHDAKYVAPEGAMGQDVRFGYRFIGFTIQKFSSQLLQQEEKKAVESGDVTKERVGDHDVTFWKERSIAGPLPKIYFYNERYFVSAEGWQDDLMKSLVSTFKFNP